MISREEIELLIMLYAIVECPCTARELTVRLGLASEHEEAVRTAILPLIAAGRIETDGAFKATESGRAWLWSRLTELAIDRAKSCASTLTLEKP